SRDGDERRGRTDSAGRRHRRDLRDRLPAVPRWAAAHAGRDGGRRGGREAREAGAGARTALHAGPGPRGDGAHGRRVVSRRGRALIQPRRRALVAWLAVAAFTWWVGVQGGGITP